VEANIRPPDVEASHTFERKHEEQRGLDSDTWAIIKLKNSAPGAPTAILVEGSVKCVICGGFIEDALVCESCSSAVRLLRAADNVATLQALVEFASRPGVMAILESLTYEAVTDMMMQRIEDARSRD
jgi:hypothetical protein